MQTHPSTRIGGVDFTSRPCRKKPITVASGVLSNGETSGEAVLHITQIERLENWTAFERFLALPALDWVTLDWVALDFPFSLPHSFLQATDWPTEWLQVTERLCQMSKAEYEHWIKTYCDSQPYGQKHHFRPTDRLTRSSSPMKLHYPPVGKMLFEGATRLYKYHRLNPQSLAILPFCPLPILPSPLVPSPPIVTRCVEGYPSLVARQFVKQYKTEAGGDTFANARANLLDAVLEADALTHYGLNHLTLEPAVRKTCLSDASGDSIDAVLCAIQAAWASSQTNGGIPLTCEAAEGWIVDPTIQVM